MDKIFGIVRMEIAPGRADDFRTRAAACIEAARKDLAGTTAYEWFLSDDGRECTVIEIYDGAEGVAHHGKMVGHTIAPLLELAKFSIRFAGNVPDAVIERMRARLGTVDYFGPRFQGRLNSPAVGAVGPDAGSMIFAVAQFSIQPGKQDEFRALAAECLAAVEAREPGTLAYEWFLNATGTECLTLDVYRDAEALAAHMANAGPTMAKILQIVKSEVKLYGNVPAAVRSRFQGGLGVEFVAPQLQGVM